MTKTKSASEMFRSKELRDRMDAAVIEPLTDDVEVESRLALLEATVAQLAQEVAELKAAFIPADS